MIKPILFSTDMVRAILDGRKTQTRRIVKLKYNNTHFKIVNGDLWKQENVPQPEKLPDGRTRHAVVCTIVRRPQYSIGDILWVRETFCRLYQLDDREQVIDGTGKYYYAADGYNPTPFNHFLDADGGWREQGCPKWSPSIHMPKEAARIFLRVTGVRVERLNDITAEDCLAEGTEPEAMEVGADFTRGIFHGMWDVLYSKTEYAWGHNPWVFVYEFERCERPEEAK